jgi:ribonuclease P protein component
MLPKKNRLNRVDFTDYYKKGRKLNGSVSTLVFTPAEKFIASVVVGKKVSKKAISRNRIRRLGYRQIELWQKQNLTNGVLILIIKPAITSLTRKDQAKALLNDLGLLIK